MDITVLIDLILESPPLFRPELAPAILSERQCLQRQTPQRYPGTPHVFCPLLAASPLYSLLGFILVS